MTETTENTQIQNSGPKTIAQALPPTVESTTDTGWLYAEGVAGEGEKPEWFNDKTFKTVTEQAKAAIELRKALGERTGSPDKYSLELGDEYKDFKFNEEDTLFKFWEGFAKEAKLPQDMFNKGLTTWIDYIKSLEQERGENFKKSIEGLGAGSDKTLEQIQTWFTNNFPEHSFDNFKMLMQTPEDIKMVLAMKDKMQGSPISTTDIKPSITMDREYWRKRMSRENGYGIDMQLTQQVDSDFRKFKEDGGNI